MIVLSINYKYMKSHHKPTPNQSIPCSEHSEMCLFVCLYKTCPHAFQLGCSKCRKDHAQHPNRLIALPDFHAMLSKPIRYLQNSTAFKLMNLKKKTQHIRNFRASILQKEIELIESNKKIKQTMGQILEEHYSIRDIVSKLEDDTLRGEAQTYIQSLKRCRDFLAYNPVKCQLVFNNDLIKNSRVSLQRHLKQAHNTTDSIRELLVKIIQVLLANCAYQQDDQQIQFEDDGGPATQFNIYIKTRIDVSENPNIKSKLQQQTFLQMFDEQKQALGKEIEMLEQQIDAKSSILSRIRGSNPCSSHHIHQNMGDSREEIEEEAGAMPFQMTPSQLRRVTSMNQQHHLSIGMLEEELGRERGRVGVLEQEVERLVEQREGMVTRWESEVQTWQSQKHSLQREKTLAEEARDTAQQSYQKTLLEYKQTNSQLISLIDQLEKKQQQVTNLKKKNEEKDRLLEQMMVNSQSVQEEGRALRKEMEGRERELVKDLGELRKELREERMGQSFNQQKAKELTLQVNQLKQQVQKLSLRQKQLTAVLSDKQQKLRTKDKQRGHLQQLHLSKVHQLQQTILNINSSSAAYPKKQEEQSKKYVQIKSMLDMSIKQNQQLKDAKFELQHQIAELREELNRKQEAFIKILDGKNRMQEEKNRIGIQKGVVEGKLGQLEELVTKMQEKIQTLEVELKATAGQEQGEPVTSMTDPAKQKNQISPGKGNNSSFIPPSFQIQTVVSEEIDGSKIIIPQNASDVPTAPVQEKALREKPLFTNKSQKMQAYMAFKQMMKTVAEDVNILQQRLKQNSVIEKVYLKQLQRKRNQNITLKKQLQNARVYAPKATPQQPSRPTPTTQHGQKKHQGCNRHETQLHPSKRYHLKSHK